MEKENLQHVQLPNDMTDGLKPKDLLIYLAIKRYMNKDTKEAFPSLERLSKETGASIPTIRESIKKLEETGYITVRKEGKKNVYHFDKWINYEPFSYEFLDNKDLTFLEKSYLVASQQYMFKREKEGVGIIEWSDSELSRTINMSRASIAKCNKGLQDKGYLEVMNAMDEITKQPIVSKQFQLSKFDQAVAFILKAHHEQINKNTEDIKALKDEIESLKRELKMKVTYIMR